MTFFAGAMDRSDVVRPLTSARRRVRDRPRRRSGASSVPIESERRLQLLILTRCLYANRSPPTIQVRGRLSLENALQPRQKLHQLRLPPGAGLSEYVRQVRTRGGNRNAQPVGTSLDAITLDDLDRKRSFRRC